MKVLVTVHDAKASRIPVFITNEEGKILASAPLVGYVPPTEPDATVVVTEMPPIDFGPLFRALNPWGWRDRLAVGFLLVSGAATVWGAAWAIGRWWL